MMTERKEHQINRIKSIYLYLKSNGPKSTQELADEFGYTIRTIQRDMKILEYNKAIKQSKGVWCLVHKKKAS